MTNPVSRAASGDKTRTNSFVEKNEPWANAQAITVTHRRASAEGGPGIQAGHEPVMNATLENRKIDELLIGLLAMFVLAS